MPLEPLKYTESHFRKPLAGSSNLPVGSTSAPHRCVPSALVTVAGMRQMSVTEQRYQAVLAVIGEGRTVSEWRFSGAWTGERCTAGWRDMRREVLMAWAICPTGR